MRSTMKKAVVFIALQSLWISCILSRQEGLTRPKIPFQYRLPLSAFSRLGYNNIISKKSLVEGPVINQNSNSNNRSGSGSSAETDFNINASTRTLVATANLINPKGFDFTKIVLPVDKLSRSSYAPVIPLIWVNLPHQDVPIFEDFMPSMYLTSVPPPLPLTLAPPPRTQQSLGSHGSTTDRTVMLEERDNRNFVIKGNVETEKLFKEENKSTGKAFGSLRTDFQERNLKNDDKKSGEETQSFNSNRIFSTEEPFVAESKNKGIQSQENKPFSVSSNVKKSTLESKPDYNFSYSVADSVTKDMKSHTEHRAGDVVRGEYSVLEPDGYTRVVTYIADAGGFKATVRRIPPLVMVG